MDIIDDLQQRNNQSEVLLYYKILQIEHELQNISLEKDPMYITFYDMDELIGVLYSHILSMHSEYKNFFQIIEISRYFNETFEMIQILLDNTSQCFTIDILQQLLELSNPSMNSIEVELNNRSINLIYIDTYLCNKLNHLKIYNHSNLIILDHPPPDSDDGGLVSSSKAIAACYVESIEFNSKSYYHIIASSDLRVGVHTLIVRTTNKQKTLTKANVTGVNPLVHINEVLLHVRSRTFDYVLSLDMLLDELFWGWNGSNWTESLEIACLELLVSIDEDLVTLVHSWNSMISMMATAATDMSSSSSDIEKLVTIVKEDITNALHTHSEYAIGRLHQTLLQFLDMKSMAMMLNIPKAFITAIENFIAAKISASVTTSLIAKIKQFYLSGKEYYQQLLLSSSSCSRYHNILQSGSIIRLASLLSDLDTILPFSVTNTLSNNTLSHNTLSNNTLSHNTLSNNALSNDALSAVACTTTTTLLSSHTTVVSLNNAAATTTTVSTDDISSLKLFSITQIMSLQTLKPQGLEMMNAFQVWNHLQADYLPILPLSTIYDPSLLAIVTNQLSETLLNDVINIQSMTGYKLGFSTPGNICTSANLILHLLNAGFAYVVSEGKLLGLLPALRSILTLQPTINNKYTDSHVNTNINSFKFKLPAQLKKRYQDMPRIFRTKVKHSLSFKINSNFDLALSKLRSHHGDDCWVGPELETVWRYMAAQEPLQLIIFELWYDHNLIAADFGHVVNNGASIYIATRFYDRYQLDVKTLMPGFLLALVECKYLQQQNCILWDLGTSNNCPLMRYKLDLTGPPLIRPYAQSELNKAKQSYYDTEVAADDTQQSSHTNNNPNNRYRGSNVFKAGTIIENITIKDLLCEISTV